MVAPDSHRSPGHVCQVNHLFLVLESLRLTTQSTPCLFPHWTMRKGYRAHCDPESIMGTEKKNKWLIVCWQYFELTGIWWQILKEKKKKNSYHLLSWPFIALVLKGIIVTRKDKLSKEYRTERNKKQAGKDVWMKERRIKKDKMGGETEEHKVEELRRGVKESVMPCHPTVTGQLFTRRGVCATK